MIRYSLNWMGPINLDWIKNNGGDWAGGRIDVYGPVATEIGLPIMHWSDWLAFGNWIGELRTVTVIELDELLQMYYDSGNPRIKWFRDLCHCGKQKDMICNCNPPTHL